jgi:ribosomal protein S6--L-glutamate ligase
MKNLKIAVLAARSDGWHAHDLRRAAPALGVELSFPDFRGLSVAVAGELPAGPGPGGIRSGRVDLADFRAVLVRSVPTGTLEQVVFRMDVLHRLEASGVAVVNRPAAIECAIDKYLALARLAAAGIAVPATRVTETAEGALSDFDALGGRTVVKPLFGSGGRGMFLLEERELAARAFRTLERIGAVIYQQEFVPLHQGDLRVLVLAGEAVLAMRRTARGPAASAGAAAPEWRTNIARGGSARPHDLSPAEALLAVRAAEALGGEVTGVDLLPAPDGRLYVSEVNSAPGWRALAGSTRSDVAALVLGHLRRRARG